jgi:hypothetical protein
MIIVRDTFQAKYGRGDELVALFKEFSQHLEQLSVPMQGESFRILTDVSGPFFTVVTELKIENLARWEQLAPAIFALPEFPAWFARMTPMVESGRREFYNLVWQSTER